MKCFKALIYFLRAVGKPETIRVCFSISLRVVQGGNNPSQREDKATWELFLRNLRCLREEEWEFPSPSAATSGCVLADEVFLGYLYSSQGQQCPYGSGKFNSLLGWLLLSDSPSLPGCVLLPFSIPIHGMVRTSHILGLHELVLTQPGPFMGTNGSGGLLIPCTINARIH